MATGCYTPHYLPASYKGVEFKAEDVSSEHGRRGAEGEFPFGENTAYADLGRRIRTYSIRARFDQNDHIADSERLIRVCEEYGPGLLVHPTRGVVTAACRSLRVSDKPETEQGVTYVDLDLVEANEWPNGFNTLSSLINLSVGSVIDAASGAFGVAYDPAGVQPFWKQTVINAAQNQVQNIATEYANSTVNQTIAQNPEVAELLLGSGSSTALFSSKMQNVPTRYRLGASSQTTVASTNYNQPKPAERQRARIMRDFARVINDDTLGAQPEVMKYAISSGMAAVAQNLTGSAKYEAFKRLANGAALQSSLQPPASTSENAVYSYVRIISAAYMAEAALEISDDLTVPEIYSILDSIETILDEEMCNAQQNCYSCLFLALSNFRLETVTELNRKAYYAPGLVQYDFGGRVSPLVAAYSIYGDAKRLREIEKINVVGSYGRVGRDVIAVSK